MQETERWRGYTQKLSSRVSIRIVGTLERSERVSQSSDPYEVQRRPRHPIMHIHFGGECILLVRIGGPSSDIRS